MEAIGDQLAEFVGAAAARGVVPEGSGAARIVRPPYQNGSMEAMGERPELGGSVVVLGRVGVSTRPDASGYSDPSFRDPVFGDPGAGIPGSPAASEVDDDDSRLSPGWPLRAVPGSPTQPNTARADHATGSAPVEATLPGEAATAVAQPVGSASLPARTVERSREPLGLVEIGRLLAEAAAAAPSILAGADYVEAANYAGQVEELSRGMEYLQVLSAGTVDRTRTQAIAAADAARASRSRTGKTWVTGWDNGVETLNETDTNWPGGSTPSDIATGNGTGTGNGKG
jgi:hypothetical protein